MSYIPGTWLTSPPPDYSAQRTGGVIPIPIYLSDFLGKCMGEEAKYEGIRLLFDGLQQPILNKQVRKHKDALRKQTRASCRICRESVHP